MAARARTLKGVVKTIESLEKSVKEYEVHNNPDMVNFYKQKLRDVKYLKSLVEKDITEQVVEQPENNKHQMDRKFGQRANCLKCGRNLDWSQWDKECSGK